LFSWVAFLDRLAEPVALAVHLEDVAVMGQAVEQGRRHALALEDLAPLAERQIAGDQQAGPFIPIRKDLEQQLGAGPAEREVAQLITDQQIHPIELAQEAVQLILLLGFLQAGDQCSRRVELDPPTGPTGRQTQGNCQMCLPDPLTPQKAEILMLVQPLAARQFHDLLLVQVRHEAEVITVQVLIDRERRLLDPCLERMRTTLRRLQLDQTQQVLEIMRVLLGRLLRQFLVLGQDRGQPQPLQMHR